MGDQKTCAHKKEHWLIFFQKQLNKPAWIRTGDLFVLHELPQVFFFAQEQEETFLLARTGCELKPQMSLHIFLVYLFRIHLIWGFSKSLTFPKKLRANRFLFLKWYLMRSRRDFFLFFKKKPKGNLWDILLSLVKEKFLLWNSVLFEKFHCLSKNFLFPCFFQNHFYSEEIFELSFLSKIPTEKEKNGMLRNKVWKHARCWKMAKVVKVLGKKCLVISKYGKLAGNCDPCNIRSFCNLRFGGGGVGWPRPQLATSAWPQKVFALCPRGQWGKSPTSHSPSFALRDALVHRNQGAEVVDGGF